MKIYLASTSPRRKELLGNMVPRFQCVSPGIDEKEYHHLTSREKTVRISKDKCIAAVNHIKEKDMVVIAGDTLVDLDGVALGKPENQDRAREMIKSLSGRRHTVYSSVSLYKNGMMYTFCDSSKVVFDTVPEDVIEEYIRTREPYDKAGGYAIQGFMGKYISQIQGYKSTVVGLPAERLEKLMAFLKII